MRHKRLEKDFDNAVGFLQEFLYGFGFGSRILEVLGGGGDSTKTQTDVARPRRPAINRGQQRPLDVVIEEIHAPEEDALITRRPVQLKKEWFAAAF